MRIAELSAFIIDLPLKREIKHASFSRRDSANLLVRCRLIDGTEGWGEGVPRDYVTGETAEGAMEMLAATACRDQLADDCGSWTDVIAMCDLFEPNIQGDDPRQCRSNALRCAVELSVLDAFGKCFAEPVGRVIHHLPEAADILMERLSVRYSTTITAESPKAERISALKMRVYGFHQCKIKVGVAGESDVERVGRIRRWIGRGFDLRLDANEAWKPEGVIECMQPLIPFGVTCIEQPVAHEELESLTEIRRDLAVPIMLDESLTSKYDASQAIDAGTCDLFNIRLSKCGGYLSSLRLAAMASRAGLGYQLGCHPGETGVLSAAGRHFASTVKDIRYLEGSYDRHLLKVLPTHQDITFGYGGRAPALSEPGLGVTIDPAILKTIQSAEQNIPVHRS